MLNDTDMDVRKVIIVIFTYIVFPHNYYSMKNSNISNLSDRICSKTFFPRLPDVTSNSLKHGRLHDFCGISPGGRREARPFWRNLSSGSRNFLSPSLIFHSHETGWKMTNGPDGPYCCLSLNQNLELPSAHLNFLY